MIDSGSISSGMRSPTRVFSPSTYFTPSTFSRSSSMLRMLLSEVLVSIRAMSVVPAPKSSSSLVSAIT